MFPAQWCRLAFSKSRRFHASRDPIGVTRPYLEFLENRNLLSLSHFLLPTPDAEPIGIVAGPDGALWFTEAAVDKIGRLDLLGGRAIAVTEFGGLKTGSRPERITVGADGALWFTEPGTNQIGQIALDGTLKEFAIPTANSNPRWIAAGADGAVWFTEGATDQIGRITPDGTIMEYAAPWDRLASSSFQGIVAGPDGALWFAEQAVHAIGRFAPGTVFMQYALPSGGDPLAITVGSDGALWFTEQGYAQIGRISVDGTIKEFGPHVLNSYDGDITAGPDGALWFLVNNTISQVQLGRITADGQESLIDVSAPFGLGGITTGSDGNIWFTETAGNAIGEWTFDGPAPAGGSLFSAIPARTAEVDARSVSQPSKWGAEFLGPRSIDLLFARQHHSQAELAAVPQALDLEILPPSDAL
jgi:virginiamycin B lyase